MKHGPILTRLLSAVVVLLTVSGCATLSALSDASTPLEVYELRSPADITPRSGQPLPVDVIIELPTTSGSLETERIMIRPSPLQAQYLPDVRWSDPTPLMVQNLMLRALERTQALRYTGRVPLGSSGDYAVVTELLDFEAELQEGGETAMIRQQFIARLVREGDARIMASRTFTASAASTSLDAPDLLIAFDAASQRLFAEFATWVVGELAGR
ncbi:ABC-type transport auxiliary lipoprotein family protein [Marivita sp.]|uniref:ABC-type transport auxiliary lipoprotein family protein n=1 Tax=Marivita sp. TaxID=2003365 RepID=UPI0025B7B271|nr:ABC-type transport auxiliary lipoprotein family protein [Marivita sp.]